MPDNTPNPPPLIPEPPRSDSKDFPPPIQAHRLDFVKLGLPEYRNKFALVVDNLFTPEDCQRYLSIAEAAEVWEQASLSGRGAEKLYVDTGYRHSDRILLDNEALATEILDRLRPYLKDIERLDKSPLHTQHAEGARYLQDPPAQISKFNERLRFLKYGPGQYFRKHCDANYAAPGAKHVSYYTLQLYLNGDPEELKGGATRFWRMGDLKQPDRRQAKDGNPLRSFVDVEPRMGRALIFEQLGLWHSGEDVEQGLKYTIRAELMYEVCPGSEQVVDDDDIVFE